MRRVAVGCLSLAALAACSDATSSATSLRAEALHFDSLTTVAVQSRAVATRIINLQIITNALAQGAEPGVVTMTISGRSVTVHVVGIQVVDTNAVDGRIYAAGWVDPDADTSISVDVTQDTTGFVVRRVALAIGDSSASTQTFPAQYLFSVQDASGSCTNVPITNALFASPMPCHLAQGAVAFTADVQNDQGALPVATLIVSPLVKFGLAQFVGF